MKVGPTFSPIASRSADDSPMITTSPVAICGLSAIATFASLFDQRPTSNSPATSGT